MYCRNEQLKTTVCRVICCVLQEPHAASRLELIHSPAGHLTPPSFQPISPDPPPRAPLPPPLRPFLASPPLSEPARNSYLPLTAVQGLTIKTAVEEPEADIERAVLLIERARDSKAPATRAGHLLQALQKLAALPAIKPPKPTGVCLAAESNDVMYPCGQGRGCLAAAADSMVCSSMYLSK